MLSHLAALHADEQRKICISHGFPGEMEFSPTSSPSENSISPGKPCEMHISHRPGAVWETIPGSDSEDALVTLELVVTAVEEENVSDPSSPDESSGFCPVPLLGPFLPASGKNKLLTVSFS